MMPDEMSGLLSTVATYLPEWMPVRAGTKEIHVLMGPGDAALGFDHRPRSSRLRVTGHMPRGPLGIPMTASDWGVVPRGQRDPSIYVEVSRPPEVIARVIKQRLLPRYLPLLDEARVLRDVREQWTRRIEQRAEKYAQALGGTAYAHNKAKTACGASWAHLVVNNHGGVTLSLNLDAEQMDSLLPALTKIFT